MSLVRWGTWGQPVLIFPTAGGDAEEIERMHLVGALMPLIEAGRIKVYSCDNLAGRAFASGTGSVTYRCALLNRFEEYVAREVVPAIRADCRSDGIEVIAAGASLGAFLAVAVTCRYPGLFRAGIGMSGSYDLERLFSLHGTDDYYFATPLSFVPNLGAGTLLDTLPDIAEAAERMLREIGRTPAGQASVRDYIGNGIPRLVKRLLTGERPEPAFLIAKPFQPANVSAVISQALFFQQSARRREVRATA